MRPRETTGFVVCLHAVVAKSPRVRLRVFSRGGQKCFVSHIQSHGSRPRRKVSRFTPDDIRVAVTSGEREPTCGRVQMFIKHRDGVGTGALLRVIESLVSGLVQN